jgi:P4 family phage/plasmid primase-like protien
MVNESEIIKNSTMRRITPVINRNTDIDNFKSYLDRCRIDKNSDSEISHLSMALNLKGKFYIDDENYDNFLKLYVKAVEAGGEFSIVEKRKEYSPVIIDIDMKYTRNENIRIYDEELINKIINFYLEQFHKYLQLTDDVQYHAYITEKKYPTILKHKKEAYNDIYDLKDGFHIHFPYINSKPELQLLIRHKLVMTATNEGWFEDYNLTNTVNDIIDKSIIEQNGLMMYLSKKPGGNSYKLTRCYNGEEDLDITELDDIQILKLLSLRSAGDEDITPFHDDFTDDIIYDICLEDGLVKKKKDGSIIDEPNKDNTHEVIKARDLSKMLAKERAINFDSWINVGFCLHNINTSLLDSWIEFSRKAGSKFKPGECEKKWLEFKHKENGYTLGSLIMWAKTDNPTSYNQYKFKELRTFLDDSTDGEPYKIADYVYEKYKDRFVCASNKYNTWYEFVGHKWKKLDNGSALKNLILTEVYEDYKKLTTLTVEEDVGNGEAFSTKLDRISKTLKGMRRIARLNEIVELLKLKFENSEFETLLDENPKLIGFKNGVYDLINMEFREGKPDDYISLSTNINYKPLNQKDTKINEIKFIINEMLPDLDVQEYVINLLASCLDGNPDQKFHLWTGSGGNGKSILVNNLIKSVFGDYYNPIDSTLITNRRGSSSAASPDKMKLKGRRICVMNEPEGDDNIKVGQMKELTGADTINARGLFQDIISFKPQFKLFMLCNKKPIIPSTDGGTWRRIRVVPFEMKFVENPKAQNERKMNRNLEYTIIKYAEIFMSILIEQYNKIRVDGTIVIPEPDKVKLSTNEYQKSSDIIADFIGERLEIIHNDKKSHIMIKDMHDEYKRWLREQYNSDRKPLNQPEFKLDMINRLGPPKQGKGWIGVRFYSNPIANEEELDDDKQEEKNEINQIKQKKCSIDL